MKVQRGRNTHLQTLCSLLFLLLASGCVFGQSVDPVIQEYENTAKGSFDVVNQGDSPLIVTISTSSFSVQENGQMTFRALDPGIHIKLSAMSLRLAPHETSRVFYSATAEQLPAWFVIYAAFSAPPRKDISGLNLRLELPHVVYLLPKHRGLKKDELSVTASYDSQTQNVHCTVQNLGDNFGRIQRLQVIGGSKSEDGSSGGMFPKSQRVFDIEWKNHQAPERIVLQFKNFKVEQPVTQQ